MKSNIPSEGEMVLLNILWDHERPMSVRELHDLLGEKEVGYTTTLKQMQRMQEKGLVNRSSEGRLHLYFPLIKRDIVKDKMLQQMVENVFQGSAVDLVLHAIDQGPITNEQLQSLEDWINKQKKCMNIINNIWHHPAFLALGDMLIHSIWQIGLIGLFVFLLLNLQR